MGERDVSWFEPSPNVSLAMLDAAGLTPDTCVVDIGGGDSRLIDELIQRGSPAAPCSACPKVPLTRKGLDRQ
jgi:hypothetical protein